MELLTVTLSLCMVGGAREVNRGGVHSGGSIPRYIKQTRGFREILGSAEKGNFNTVTNDGSKHLDLTLPRQLPLYLVNMTF